MSGSKRIAGNLLYLLLGGVIASVLEFLTEVTLARRLTDQGFGHWSYVQSVIIYLLLIMDMGLAVYGAREIARYKDKAAEFIANIVAIKTLLAIVILSIFSAVILLLDMPSEMKILYIGGALLLIPQALNPEFIYQGYERMAGIALWRISNFLFYFILVFFLTRDRSSLWAVPYYKAGAGIISVVILWLIVKKVITLPRFSDLNVKVWPGYIRIAVIMAFSFVIINVYHTFDTLMLGVFTTPETVGWYNAAYKVILQFVGLAIILQVVFGPVFSRQRDKSAELAETFYYFCVLLMIIAGIVCGLVFLMGEDIILLLFGQTYANAIGILRLLSISLLFVFIQFIFTSPLLYCGFEKVYLVSMFAGAAVNVTLNFIFIPLFGYIGAAVATIFSNVVIGLAGYSFLKTRLDIPPEVFKTILNIALFTTVAVAGLSVFAHSYTAGLIFIIVYSIFIMILYGRLIWELMTQLFRKISDYSFEG